MKPEFWLQAWSDGKRGFHLDHPHVDLVAHAENVFAEGTVVVPLCGASHDLAWLAENGWQAVGVELSPIAVDELCTRDGLHPVEDRGPFKVFSNGDITVLQGDFFELQPDHMGPIAGIWDRAAMVAMHPAQRQAYAEVERTLLGSDAALLLNVLEYDASKLNGPPWAIYDETVKVHWPEAELLDERTDAAQGRFAEHVETMTRRLYRILL